jgi:hypothetical protein
MPSFLPFRPDAGEMFSSTVSNVLMTAGAYGPRPSLQTAPGAAALAAAPRGAFGGYLPNGAFKGFGATSTKVYTLDAAFTWTALAPNFTVPADDDEAMTQFGVFMLASNTTDGMYAYNMDTPAGLNAVSGAPAARYMFSANNQVIALGAGGSLLNRLSTSAFGSHTNWTSRGSSKQDMNDGGAFTGGGDIGNGAAIILQLRAVRRMTFGQAGGGALFRLDKLGDDVGCVHPRAQVTYNGVIYFIHTDGWYACDGNGPPVNIGAGKINQWFLARVSDLKKVYLSVDPKNTVIRARYAASGDGSTATVFKSILDYNWVTKEFVPGTEDTSAIFRMGTPGYTLNTISTAFGVLDAWSQYPLDSAFWQGGNFRLAALDEDFKFGFFDGAAAAAVVETPTETDGISYLVTRCRLLSDDPTATVQVGVKSDMSEQIVWSDEFDKVGTQYPVRARGVFQRYRVNHAAAATWTRDTAIGDIEKRASAGR